MINLKRFSFFIVALIIISSIPITTYAVHNDIQPRAEVIPCPNCDTGDFTTLGPVYRTWTDSPTPGTCEFPAGKEYDHDHTFVLDYILHRCLDCGYEVRFEDYSSEICPLSGGCWGYRG